MKNKQNADRQSSYSQRHNPDDRSDNVERIQKSIDTTIQNMELADEMIAKTDDCKTKKDLKAKNDRRETALGAMRNEIKDEADWRGKKQ